MKDHRDISGLSLPLKSVLNACYTCFWSFVQEPVVSEEVELIVESLLGDLMRTILEISNRPQPAGPTMRLQFQDVTVCVFYRVQHNVLLLIQIVLGLDKMCRSNYII